MGRDWGEWRLGDAVAERIPIKKVGDVTIAKLHWGVIKDLEARTVRVHFLDGRPGNVRRLMVQSLYRPAAQELRDVPVARRPGFLVLAADGWYPVFQPPQRANCDTKDQFAAYLAAQSAQLATLVTSSTAPSPLSWLLSTGAFIEKAETAPQEDALPMVEQMTLPVPAPLPAAVPAPTPVASRPQLSPLSYPPAAAPVAVAPAVVAAPTVTAPRDDAVTVLEGVLPDPRRLHTQEMLGVSDTRRETLLRRREEVQAEIDDLQARLEIRQLQLARLDRLLHGGRLGREMLSLEAQQRLDEQVLAYVSENPGCLPYSEKAQRELNLPMNRIRSALGRLEREGRLVRASRGRYRPYIVAGEGEKA